ncbi:MAG: bifunctional helix-turn-helix transcriptional regulator/GNAT family N-acetyltransferase, partial [Rhodothermales bacterium]
MAATTDVHPHAEAIRRFNRFYTRQIGVLQEGLLESPFSLTEARVLYELAHREDATATDLAGDLRLDHGYLSRILRRFEQEGLLAKRTSEADGRRRHLHLTPAGRDAFGELDERSQNEIGATLDALSSERQRRLLGAMETIERLLSPEAEQQTSYQLRAHRPGDMGWVIERHGALYAKEYGWDAEFEALVAEISAAFLRSYNPAKERCWIAEVDGERVGCVFVVERTETVAQLRMLLVEPAARGMGLGRRLVDECLAFAREAGYASMMLWTNSVLHAARHIY